MIQQDHAGVGEERADGDSQCRRAPPSSSQRTIGPDTTGRPAAKIRGRPTATRHQCDARSRPARPGPPSARSLPRGRGRCRWSSPAICARFSRSEIARGRQQRVRGPSQQAGRPAKRRTAPPAECAKSGLRGRLQPRRSSTRPASPRTVMAMTLPATAGEPRPSLAAEHAHQETCAKTEVAEREEHRHPARARPRITPRPSGPRNRARHQRRDHRADDPVPWPHWSASPLPTRIDGNCNIGPRVSCADSRRTFCGWRSACGR